MSKKLFFPILTVTYYNYNINHKNQSTVPDLVQSSMVPDVKTAVYVVDAPLLLLLNASQKCFALSPPLLLEHQTVPPGKLPSSCVILWTTQTLSNYWSV